MEVLAVTIFLSLCLAGFFVVMFLASGHRAATSLEQESLLPLEDDAPAMKAPTPVNPPLDS